MYIFHKRILFYFYRNIKEKDRFHKLCVKNSINFKDTNVFK